MSEAGFESGTAAPEDPWVSGAFDGEDGSGRSLSASGRPGDDNGEERGAGRCQRLVLFFPLLECSSCCVLTIMVRLLNVHRRDVLSILHGINLCRFRGKLVVRPLSTRGFEVSCIV